MAQRIWIVQHDESPENTVRGVFDDELAADRFAKEAQASARPPTVGPWTRCRS